jgi:hypothetical protein
MKIYLIVSAVAILLHQELETSLNVDALLREEIVDRFHVSVELVEES